VPTSEVLAESVVGQVAALPASLVAAGVIAPGLVATAIGFGLWWAFGLFFLALTVGAWWAIGRLRAVIGNVFFRPFRYRSLAALWLGAVPTLLMFALTSLLVVAPVSAKRASDERDRDARGLVDRAEVALERGDVDRADRLLDNAQRKRRDVAGLAETRRRVGAARREQIRERERRDAYADARSDFREGEYESAVTTLESLGTYRNAALLAEEFRRDGARDLRDQAREALADRRYDPAIELAEQAQDLRVTSPASRLIAQAEKQQKAAEERARARARARERARRAAAERRAERRRIAREQRAAERRAEEQAERERLESYETPDVPDYDSGGSNGNWCGASRDGDGDGIWCEGR
jgi:hypothetical protein